MNPREAITELELTYDKKLTDFQITRYTRFLGKFNQADIDKIIEKAMEDSRYLPRIAQLNDAGKDLLILKPERRSKTDPNCSICSGTGWEYATVNNAKTKHEDVQAVKPCSCKHAPHIAESEEIPF